MFRVHLVKTFVAMVPNQAAEFGDAAFLVSTAMVSADDLIVTC